MQMIDLDLFQCDQIKLAFNIVCTVATVTDVLISAEHHGKIDQKLADLDLFIQGHHVKLVNLCLTVLCNEWLQLRKVNSCQQIHVEMGQKTIENLLTISDLSRSVGQFAFFYVMLTIILYFNGQEVLSQNSYFECLDDSCF